MLVLSLISLLTLLNLGLQIAGHFRRRPPLSQELASYQRSVAEVFATKAELIACEARWDTKYSQLMKERREDLDILHKKLDDYQATNERIFQDINRALGRLEGSQ